MKVYTQEEMEDRVFGVKGTPKRDAYEAEINAFLVGEALKKARQAQNMTQEELGKLVGVQKAQISRIENGKNLTFTTVIRLLKALGLSARLEIDKLGKVAIC
ncbi:MAG: helix-turn-helix transcriptional regulator [Bacteroidaceae bacterium]|nr:helix-turn-helix transcriptional regulator [Bacteroidaceae bacterium]